jgi:Cu(I)/Ag(I) efflux system membrane fusion protein
MSNSSSVERRRGRSALVVGGALGALVIGALGYGTYRLGMMRGLQMAGEVSSNVGAQMKAGEIDPATGKRLLYWHDPMVPGQRFDQPGKSPFMNMALVPVYEGGDDGAVEVSPRIQQNLGIRTADVVRAALTPQIEAVGNITYDERDQVIVQARATAYVERLHVRATLDEVRAGEPLAELYVPAWIAVQEEFVALATMRGADSAILIDAARQRMRQAGMTDEQVRDVEDSGAIRPGITLRAPIAGVVVELAAREGMTVMPGETLFKINGLDTVWANAEVPESQAALLRPGAPVEARSPAVPSAVFAGTVQAILPDIDPNTRTIKARVELANTDRELAPGMFVNITLSGPTTDALLIPTEAVIATGRRTVVIRAEPNGTFQPVDVEIGVESNGRTEIKSGLDSGDKIVVSGQFLLDSEASLRATSTRMETMPAPSTGTTHIGDGRIEALDGSTVTLSHGPIPSAQWGSMTMQFELPASTPAAELEVGQAVHFTFVLGDDGKPRIVEITPAAGGGQ